VFIKSKRFFVDTYFRFDNNGDIYIPKFFLDCELEFLLGGSVPSTMYPYRFYRAYRDNNGYVRIIDYFTISLKVPRDLIEYSNGIFKIDGRVLDIDTISLKPDLDSELYIYNVYAESYEIYKELERVALEYIVTHWEESYGGHIEGLGHKKVLIEKYNDDYDHYGYTYTYKWHDTGEYVDCLSGCPHCILMQLRLMII
jgi:hypothetical protein